MSSPFNRFRSLEEGEVAGFLVESLLINDEFIYGLHTISNLFNSDPSPLIDLDWLLSQSKYFELIENTSKIIFTMVDGISETFDFFEGKSMMYLSGYLSRVLEENYPNNNLHAANLTKLWHLVQYIHNPLSAIDVFDRKNQPKYILTYSKRSSVEKLAAVFRIDPKNRWRKIGGLSYLGLYRSKSLVSLNKWDIPLPNQKVDTLIIFDNALDNLDTIPVDYDQIIIKSSSLEINNILSLNREIPFYVILKHEVISRHFPSSLHLTDLFLN